MIEFVDVTKTYYMGKQQYHALKGINFSIEEGETVAIIGPSGSGKTSTMNIIGLLAKPTSGKYILNGEDTSRLTQNQLAKRRNLMIGFIFQSFFLLPRLTALQNVTLPLTYRNVSKKKRTERASMVLERMGMIDYVTHRPYELSGGQQQRVAIARALVGEPDVILADEPTGALDSKTSQIVMDLLLEQAQSKTLVIITHDPEIAGQCKRIIKIYDGLIEEDSCSVQEEKE